MSAQSEVAGAARQIGVTGRARRRRAGRILKVFGVLCLAAAVGVGGYLTWLLWGTGLYTQRAQTELRQSFHPASKPPPSPSAPVVKLPGDAVAIMQIPRIDLNMVVVEGTSTDDLKKGPGHYSDTAYPWQDHGTAAIAGHRTTYLHPFYSLDKMRAGDKITLLTEYGTYRYVVTKVEITTPTDSSVLAQTAKPTLVLTTCNPRYSASERLIVFADRV